MTLKKWSLLAFAAALIAPMSASALGISIANVSTSSPNLDGSLENEDTITFDLLLENSGNLDILGLDVGVFGYDEGAIGSEFDNHLLYESAQTGPFAFRAIDPVTLTSTQLNASRPQSESGSALLFQERYVNLFGGVDTEPTNGDGTLDVGIGGGLTDGSDVHLQVTFSAQALGATPGAPATVDLIFGIGQQGFDVQGPSGSLASQWTNATYTVTIVPEPGTALLMGLGLAGLAGTRRR